MRLSDNGKGWVFQRPGAVGKADMIRVMNPDAQNPSGYVVVYNNNGYWLNEFGKHASTRTAGHISLTHSTPIPNWPGR